MNQWIWTDTCQKCGQSTTPQPLESNEIKHFFTTKHLEMAKGDGWIISNGTCEHLTCNGKNMAETLTPDGCLRVDQ